MDLIRKDQIHESGYPRYLKGNMLSWCATSPRNLPLDPVTARGPENLDALLAMTREAETVVLAFGSLHRRYRGIVAETLDALHATGRPLSCLAQNADGAARHPLYLPDDTPLRPFDPTRLLPA